MARTSLLLLTLMSMQMDEKSALYMLKE